MNTHDDTTGGGMQAADQSAADVSLFEALDTVISVKEIRRGVEVFFEGESARFECIFPDVVRVQISRSGRFDPKPTDAVIRDEFGDAPHTLEIGGDHVVLSTEDLTLTIDTGKFSFRITGSDGRDLLLSDPEAAYAVFNDRWRVSRMKSEGDRLYGFGEKTGPLDKNGRRLVMWNTDIIAERGTPDAWDGDADPYYVSIPFFHHLRFPEGAEGPVCAAGSYIDNGRRLVFDMTAPDRYTITAGSGHYTEYVFAGPSMGAIIERYTALTGKPAVPPLWALGHHQCRWHDYDEAAFTGLAENYRRNRIPCDSLWLDIDHMDGFRIFTWDGRKFPDPRDMMAKLRRDGFRSVTIVDPGVKREEGYDLYDEGLRKNVFCRTREGSVFTAKVWPGGTVFPDFTLERTRAWWAARIDNHVRDVVDGVWIDMNEPAFTGADHDSMRFDRDGSDHDHDRFHNQYALFMAKATRDGMQKARPNERPFVLSRAGSAGIQRCAAIWTGDNASRWEHLAMSITMCAGLGLSGQPFNGSDIGGFGEDVTEELLVRWYQYAAFQPFMRNHSMKGTAEQYPWSFGDRALDAIRSAVELRYSLLPYLYSAIMGSTVTGHPVQRPPAFDFQADTAAHDIEDQFMFGGHIMAAPVMEAGMTSRTVYLPAGGWYAYGDANYIEGGRTIEVETPLDAIPVFVRAGAVIPTAPVFQSTAEYAPDTITLAVYMPSADGTWKSALYEDDGISVRYRDGDYYRTDFTLERSGDVASLAGETSGGGFLSFSRRSFRIRVFGGGPPETTIRNTGEHFSLALES